MPREGGCVVVVRQGHLIAVVSTFLIGCAVLLLAVGCAGTRSETSKEQEPTEASKKEQGRSPQATASEEARCEGTRTITLKLTFQAWTWGSAFTTNDVPDCPKGGLLLGTDKSDVNPDHPSPYGKDGDDEIRALGGSDVIFGGDGNDVLSGGPGDDWGLFGGKGDDVIYGGPGDEGHSDQPPKRVLAGGAGEDVIYGGDGDDFVDAIDANRKPWVIDPHRSEGQRDELYCGKGKDYYDADKKDFVSSSCETKRRFYPTMREIS